MSDTSKLPITRVDNLDTTLTNVSNSIDTINQNVSQLNTDLTNINTDLTNNINSVNTTLLNLITALTQRVSILESQKHITETWSEGTEWYRVWSDGWIEQGGYMYETGATTGIAYTKTLHKPYTTTNYTILMWAGVGNSGWQYCGSVGLGTGGNAANLRENNVKTNQFTYFDATGVSGTPVFWYACGY